MASNLVCNSCGHVGQPNKVTPGSFGIEVLLWLFICLPGVIYSLWRHGNVYNVCARCGSRALIPADAPAAQNLQRATRRCPFCAEEVQAEAVVCKHCGRDLPALPAPPPPPPVAPTPSVTDIRLVSGMTRNIGLAILGVGFILSWFPGPIRLLGLLLLFVGGATLLVNGPQGGRLLIAGLAAIALFVPSTAFYAARGAKQAKDVQQQQQAAAAAASRMAAEKAKSAADEAARRFPEQQTSIQERLTATESAAKSKDWPKAQQGLQSLQTELAPLFRSDLAKSPEVVAIKGRLDALQTATAAYTKQQQLAEAKKKVEAAAAAEMAQRAAWTPEPVMMSVKCARYAKEGILDGDAQFAIQTLAKSGKTFTMQGRVTGHNAFNARIAKRVTCKVHMDMKTGTQMYTTTVHN